MNIRASREITDFVSVMAAPRSEIVTRSEATGRLNLLMKQQMDLLNQKADKLMVLFKNNNPMLYNEYKSARIIVNMGIRHEETIEESVE